MISSGFSMRSGLSISAYRLARNTALVVVSCAISLLALEVAVRLLDGVSIFSMQNFVDRELDEIKKSAEMPMYDARLGWLPMPMTSWNFPRGAYTHGEYGVRMSGPQFVPLQQGTILMVGDSFGEGAGVDNDEAWPAQLERALDTQVIDAAVGGFALDQIVLRAESLLPLLNPRVLLVETRLEYGNSVDRMSVVGGLPKPYFTVQNGELMLQNVPVPKLASSSHEIGWTRAVFGYSYFVQYVITRLNLLQWWIKPNGTRTKWELSESEACKVACLLMRRLAQIRDQHAIRVALVLQYSALEGIQQPLDWENTRSFILACAREQGLDVVDTLDALRSEYRRGVASYQRLWRMQDGNRIYGHMSAEGNRLIARLVARQLFERELSVASPR
jgi:hypothetical protein